MILDFLESKDKIKINNLAAIIYGSPANPHICLHEHSNHPKYTLNNYIIHPGPWT